MLKHIAGNFRILHLLSWATAGAYTPFIVIFLMYNNISTAQIGVVLMLNSLATLIGQPLWGMISDKIRSIKKVYLACIFIASVLIMISPFVKNKYAIFVLLPAITFFFCCLSPLLDSWTIFSIKNSGRSYGSFRLWGSLGYSIIVIIVGKLINMSSVNIIFPVYFLLSLIMLLTCGVLFEYKGQEDGSAIKALSLRELRIGRLLGNYHYVTFVIMACIMNMTFSSFYSFLPTLMNQVGGNDELYGIATAVSAFSEVPILLISSRLIRRFKPQALMLAGLLVYIFRLCIYSIAWSPGIIIFVQAFQGLSFALFLSGSIYYIDSLAPAELKSTAQTVATAIYGGLSGIIGNFVTGLMISEYGILFVFKVGAIVDSAVFVLFLASLYIGRRFRRFSREEDLGLNN